MAKDKNKKQRQKVYEKVSHERFINQRKKMLLPNICYLAVVAVLFLILMIWDSPQVIFDESSQIFSYLLLIIVAVPLISLIVVWLSKKTVHLLVTITLHSLTIIPLILGFGIKYEEMKACSSYHMLSIYFLFFLVYITMTTVFNKIRKNYLNYDDEI